ncbi:MAG: SRPBCC family protein [Flavobacteriaceae bacterium]|nr:SRPBCC family protein [Flavobacteriaceae bacterium]
MKLESPKIVIDKSPEETYKFLSDVNNFRKLMPDSIERFEVLGPDSFIFSLKGMPEITLKKKEEQPPNKLVLGAAGGKIDFSLQASIEEVNPTTSQVELKFEGDFNPMMAMMIKTPIKNFINTLATNIPLAIQ